MTSPYDADPPVTSAEQIVKSVAVVIASVAVVSNLTVASAQLRTPALRRTGLQWLFIALQLNDATLMTAVGTTLAYQLHDNITPTANDALCTAQASITIFCGVTSWIVLGLIALNRWYLVVLGRRWRPSTYLAILAVSLACSCVSVALQISNVIPVYGGPGRLVCLIQWSDQAAVTQFMSTLTVFELLVAATICVVAYVSIFHHVRRIKLNLDNTQMPASPRHSLGSPRQLKSNNRSSSSGADEMELVARLCIVTIGQALLWITLLASIVYNTASGDEVSATADQIQLTLAESACMIMPWLVCWVQRSVRVAVVRLLTLQPAASIKPTGSHSIEWNDRQLEAATSTQMSEVAVVPSPRTPRMTYSSQRLY